MKGSKFIASLLASAALVTGAAMPTEAQAGGLDGVFKVITENAKNEAERVGSDAAAGGIRNIFKSFGVKVNEACMENANQQVTRNGGSARDVRNTAQYYKNCVNNQAYAEAQARSQAEAQRIVYEQQLQMQNRAYADQLRLQQQQQRVYACSAQEVKIINQGGDPTRDMSDFCKGVLYTRAPGR